MDFPEALLLLAAGLAAGMVNAVAGGGSLITFPAMIAVGLPPIAANVSNSMSVCPGYLASVWGSRVDLPDRRWLLRLIPGTVLARPPAARCCSPPRPGRSSWPYRSWCWVRPPCWRSRTSFAA
ncbi:hypothetical protein GCM10022225_31660 [Plantactinospora mayteni]|uniref:Probable membrane transporter protein n=1 Tax=Plantactinospora mayteni TaxID=566021 RepID=A0ABQ4ELU9_9ACTN|nr:hypothetical protein Pma05_22430 [Plantactinospora mayteni]